MLKQRNPYPEVGSYALFDGEGASTPVRILQLIDGPDKACPEQGRRVQVSLIERPEASGCRTLRLADLNDADPLGAAEREEMKALEAKLFGRRRPRARDAARRAEHDADVARHEALRLRAIRAPILTRLLEEHAKREAARCAPARYVRSSIYAPA